MSDAYSFARTSKLSFKNDTKKGTKRKHKSKKGNVKTVEVDKDTLIHGNWWKVTKFSEISGPVSIEFGKHTYIKALDNGTFTLGAPHNDFEGPFPEEILTGIKIDERKIAFKSGYGKYLRVEKNGCVTGRSDAIGPMEQWEPVFQDGKLALQSYSEGFLSIDLEDSVVAINKKAGKDEIVQIRCQSVKEDTSIKEVPTEEQGTLDQVELNYVKKFQKFQDKKIRLNKEDIGDLEKAKTEGTFHEKLLDRRSKMKADRYCK